MLLKPPFQATTYALWFGPLAIGLLGLIAMIAFYRQGRRINASRVETELTEDEQERFNAIRSEARRNSISNDGD